MNVDTLYKRFKHLGNIYPSCSDKWLNILWMILTETERRNYPKWMPIWVMKMLYHFKYRPVHISQIKEKFGALRIYDCDDDLYDYAQLMSENTCEICGTTHQVGHTKGIWIYTICKICQENTYPNMEWIRR